MFASYRGLGYRLMQYMTSSRVDEILALFLIIVITAVAVNLALVRIELAVGRNNA